MSAHPDEDLRACVRTWVIQWNDALKSMHQGDLHAAPPAQKGLQRIKPYWPLKKGAVDRVVPLAWQTAGSCSEVVQECIAFFLKATAVQASVQQKKLSGLDLFCQDTLQLLFWDDVRPLYLPYTSFREEGEKRVGGRCAQSRASFVQDELIMRGNVVLCLEDHGFRLRSGANPDLCAFECFLEDLMAAGNGLVVFGRQALLKRAEKNTSLEGVRKEGYKISFKISRDFIKTSLEETMEPPEHVVRSAQFVEPIKPGCFDRLLQLLALGQEFVTGVEERWRPSVPSSAVFSQKVKKIGYRP